MTEETCITPDALVRLIAARAEPERRLLVAIAGPPGAGKSTLAEALAAGLDAVGDIPAMVVPMDGFHYDNRVLAERGLLARKGAPDTFDVAGFAALVARLATSPRDVAIPLFDRTLDLVRAAAAIVTPAHRVLLTEGNYLLLDESPWCDVAQYYGLTLAIQVPFDELERRLVRRWLDHGLGPDAARARALANDIPNARRVAASSRKPDFWVAGASIT
jgi:pantothenate kinase